MVGFQQLTAPKGLFRDAEGGSNGVKEGHQACREVEIEEGVPWFDGSTGEYFAVEGEVRAEDFDDEVPQLQGRAGKDTTGSFS